MELRYSLNGITQTQLEMLFANIAKHEDQIILKRASDPHIALSIDDIVLEGIFSTDIIQMLSRIYPPPLSFKMQMQNDLRDEIRGYSSFQWQENPRMYCGVTLLPFVEIQKMIGFVNAWQFLRLITTTEAGSILKPLLAVKPKGIITSNRSTLNFILPNHRIDFLSLWINQIIQGHADLDWLSGTTGELPDEILQTIGSISPDHWIKLQGWVNQVSVADNIDFERLFKRVLSVVTI